MRPDACLGSHPLLSVVELQHFAWHALAYALCQYVGDACAHKVGWGDEYDLACGNGQGEGSYQLALRGSQLLQGQFGYEGDAQPGFDHAHEGFDAPQRVAAPARCGRFQTAKADQLVAEAVAFVEQPE